MIILAIESSCDETACAIVRDSHEVLANVISSQIGIHQVTQGVVPEVAARAHVEKLQIVLDQALKSAKCDWDQIDTIAVTAGPGLLTSVMNGVVFASTLAFIKGKPLIPVNHINGHLISASLGLKKDEVEFPIVILSVSGGHNDLYLAKSYCDFELLGTTSDDAAGEAYDKVAKMLKLGYPGGPIISKMALNGNPYKYKLPMPVLKKGYEFSFSGLKSAFSRLLDELGGINIVSINKVMLADLCASFQETINEVLAFKATKAATEFNCKEVHLVGGVSANLALREKTRAYNKNITFRCPLDFGYCTDNAAMIAGAAFYVKNSDWCKTGEVPQLITW